MTSQTNPNPHKAAAVNESSWAWLRMFLPSLVLGVLAFAVAWHFVKPAPPAKVVIATGSSHGMYYAMANRYAKFFADHGVELVVRETGGSIDNYKLLNTPGGDVDIAIVQGGTAPTTPSDLPDSKNRSHVEAVAGIYFEPVMVFYRGDADLTKVTQLAGRKIAVGAEGSGARAAASLLLTEAGAIDQTNGTVWLSPGGDQAADALIAGQADAAFFAIAPDAPVVQRLLQSPGIRLMSFDHANAYSRLHPFLSAATLYQGSVNIPRNLPAADVSVVAATATLAIRDTTHPAIIQLLVRAAQEMNHGATLLSDVGVFPNADRLDLPVNSDARYYLKNAPNILHRTFPFWLAAMFDRLIILVVPLIVVLIPLVRVIPPALKWRVQRKFFDRYKRVRQIEARLQQTSAPEDLNAGRDELESMEKDLATLKVPISYAEELYNLRRHLADARSRLEGSLQPAPQS